jgi:mannose-1-phosphate guanylyltransferase
VYGLSLPGYWLDVGTPDSYLQAHRDVLERRFLSEVGEELGSDYMLVAETAQVHPEARLVPPVYVGANATIGAGACVGSLAVVGAGAVLGAGAVVESSVVGADAIVGGGSTIIGSIIGEGARLGEGCEALGLSVVGPGAHLATGNTLNHGLRLAADVSIPEGAVSFA